MLDFSLPDLTPNEMPWRLDWLGEVSYPATSSRWSQPSVRVSISPIDQELNFQNENGVRLYGDQILQRNAWLPIGVLRALKVGTIWRKGFCIADPCYEQEVFQDLIIDHETTSYLKSGSSFDDAYLLPWGTHPWHKKHTHSNGACIALPDGRRVFIPCLELIRFYFGSTGKLIGRLFSGPLREENLWQEIKFNDLTRHLHLKLAPQLSGPAAADIGRVALNRTAWRAATHIYQSCAQDAAERRQVNPFTCFPFVGKTTLQVSGAWLPFNGVDKSTFVVFSLQSCSHPFPFQSLSYELEQPISNEHEASKRDNENANLPSLVRRNMQEPAKLVDGNPDKNKSIQARWVNDKSKFPDLNSKPVWLDKIEYTDVPKVYLRHDNGTIALIAFGEPVGVGARQTDLLDSEDGFFSIEKLPLFVLHGINQVHAIRRSENVSVVAHPYFGKKIFSLPTILDEDGVLDLVTQFKKLNGTFRPRRGCFIESVSDKNDKKCFVVFENEVNKNVANIYPMIDFYDELFDEIYLVNFLSSLKFS